MQIMNNLLCSVSIWSHSPDLWCQTHLGLLLVSWHDWSARLAEATMPQRRVRVNSLTLERKVTFCCGLHKAYTNIIYQVKNKSLLKCSHLPHRCPMVCFVFIGLGVHSLWLLCPGALTSWMLKYFKLLTENVDRQRESQWTFFISSSNDRKKKTWKTWVWDHLSKAYCDSDVISMHSLCNDIYYQLDDKAKYFTE